MNTDEHEKFEQEKKKRIKSYKDDSKAQSIAKEFVTQSCYNEYTYNFSWMGRPIIQFPQDMIVMQELIWEQQPDLIIETGIAHGGSLVFYASIMELIGKGRILGVDVEIREHNREAIEHHPMSHRIKMIEGSSIEKSTIEKVQAEIKGAEKIMVCLDSKHTHDHVLEELNLYHPFVSKGSYLVVFDTTAQIFDESVLKDLAKSYRFSPWGKDSNPHSALEEFLEGNDEFEIDKDRHLKAMITNCFDGFLKKNK
jgi:cephalosporin hydroxylase